MERKELAAWSLIAVAILSGSLTASSIAGCKPNSSVSDSDFDLDVDSGVLDSNVTATAETPMSPASEVPMEPADAGPVQAEPVQSKPATTSNDIMAPPAASTKSASPEVMLAAATPAAAPAASESAADSSAAIGEIDDPTKVLEAGGDWPQWGGTRWKNNAPGVTGLPESWKPGKFDRKTGAWDKSLSENIRWVSNLGSQTYGNPVIANGRVYVGTNNGAGHLARYPSETDLGCLLCFDEKTGELLWQHSSEKLITGRVHDWPLQGICCSPLVEGDRLWFVTSRGEVRCLDTSGFHDGEDNGPFKDEPARVVDMEVANPAYKETLAKLDEGQVSDALKSLLESHGEPASGNVEVASVTAGKVWNLTGSFNGVTRKLSAKVIGPRLSLFKNLSVNDKKDADVIWVYDMMDKLGTSQHNMASCSVTAYGDLLFVNTSNGQDESHINLPAPNAPSFICMNKNTAEVYWTDKSPGENILHGQWSSPAIGEIDGVPQVIFAGGDGIIYSFRADKGKDGKPELLWQFDANPKETIWILGGEGTRNNLIATPVIYKERVYIAVGQDPEHGEGEGHLWCIDPTKRGDISPQLAMKMEEGQRVAIAHKREQAVEPELGEVAVDNPNSGAIWHYAVADQNEDGEIDFEETMHRTIGTVAIKDDILYVTDLSGVVHCLDVNGAGDGKAKVHFTYDMLAQSWGSPLIADGRVFLGDEDGDIAIFELSPESNEPIAEINMGTSIYSTPVAANGTIFISTKDKLFAIAELADTGSKE
jgi:outer membrane protein assembly factor BamB